MINGKIKVDPSTGTPLNLVESKRDELKNSIKSKLQMINGKIIFSIKFKIKPHILLF